MDIQLTSLEARIMGCMIEKELATPEYYPMTLNSLILACNQKSNRNPVMKLSESEVKDTVLSLQNKKLCKTIYLSNSRSARYKHYFDDVFGVSIEEKAVLCELFLRGAQTPGELNTHTGRMIENGSLEMIDTLLERFISREKGPYIQQLDRQPGQKESRYAHLFCGKPEPEIHTQDSSGNEEMSSLLARLEKLESQVSLLNKEIENLKSTE